ncbi:DNA repair protein RecO C-terminal domain-containing protein [Weissella confusa]|uniref:DNA repair protein RecO C-terminal domain-containing protein n=1 Tax=Weissella confusa TaxID=1583 RepID=A0A923NEW0_WEICO|nr:DNA repair protein RecO C-terminal domain-containing protein [Weissella confusa]
MARVMDKLYDDQVGVHLRAKSFIQQLSGLAKLALEKLEEGLDPQGLANYFEVQLLPAFGLNPTWGECAVCGRRDLPLDFSEKLNGTICQIHWDQAVQPMTIATFEGTLNQTGLSFINSVKESHHSRELMMDVEKNAYMTYILGLIDAAFVDNQPIEKWFNFLMM